MDASSMGRKRGAQYRRRKNDFTYWDKSSSEPDLTGIALSLTHFPQNRRQKYVLSNNLLDHTSNCYSSRWKKGPPECITVDELKFYRRGRPPGSTTPPPNEQLHTSSSFTLYNKSEPYIPFSALKTEYQRQYCRGSPEMLSPRPPLLRRSTSLKLPNVDGNINSMAAAAESEQHSEYHPYTHDEMSNCRRSLANRPDNLGANDNNRFDALDGQTVHFDGNVAFMSEPHFDAKHKSEPAEKHASQKNHLNLTGELSMVPEYRSQFVTFPIEKSHSIPQISNINFQGKFGGVAEYRDSFREYDHYSKCDAIKNPGHLRTNGAVKGSDNAAEGEYTEKFKAPDHKLLEKSVLAKQDDTFRLPEQSVNRQAEYNENFADPKLRQFPIRGKPRADFLALNGKMVYNPEYRSTYLDFPRTRPIQNKPKSSFQLGDRHKLKTSRSPSPNESKKFDSNPLIRNVHDPNLEEIPFLYQPEVRRAKQDLLIKKRVSRKDSLGSQILTNQTADSFSPKHTNPSSPVLVMKMPTSRHLSPKFKLTVKNVDDPGGQFKKTTPKFGRRSMGGKDAHKLRNRSKIVEANRTYSHTARNLVDQSDAGQQLPSKRSIENPQSFVVLKEPCQPSNWMKSSWYS